MFISIIPGGITAVLKFKSETYTENCTTGQSTVFEFGVVKVITSWGKERFGVKDKALGCSRRRIWWSRRGTPIWIINYICRRLHSLSSYS